MPIRSLTADRMRCLHPRSRRKGRFRVARCPPRIRIYPAPIRKRNKPLNWDSIHGEQVRMVVLLALRQSETANTHMQVFSSLARKLDDDDFRQHLLKIETAEQVTTYLAEQLGLPSWLVNGNPVAAERTE